MSHTLGPWTWRDAWADRRGLHPIRLANEQGETVLYAEWEHHPTDLTVSRADGELIAAAPDLLETAKDVKKLLQALTCTRRNETESWQESAHHHPAAVALNAAIAKAEGGRA